MATAPEQIRAPRARLRLEQADLALVPPGSASGSDIVSHDTVSEISRMLEQAGAEFIPGGAQRRPTIQPDTPMLGDIPA